MNKYVKRYLIDALGGMAQGLFASLLIGTIVKTLGQQLLRLGSNPIFTFLVDAGAFASDAHVVGAAMAVGIGFAMQVPALVLFTLAATGSAANVSGGAGGPLAVLLPRLVRGRERNGHILYIHYLGLLQPDCHLMPSRILQLIQRQSHFDSFYIDNL